MESSFTFYTFLSLVGCIAAGIFFAWVLYSKADHVSKNVRYLLAVIRATLVTIISFLLFFPLLRTISYELEKPLIIIGQDNSISAGQVKAAGFNSTRYEMELEELSDKLSEKYDVRKYSFSDTVSSGFDFSYKGKLTNAYKFISKINDELQNRNIGAVILSSDGIFNRGGSPLYDLSKLKAPVYTIALGDTIPKKDLKIANVNSNDIVYLDNEFVIEVQVQAFESKGALPVLKVSEAGRELSSTLVAVSSNPFVKTLALKVKATKLGTQKYTLTLTSLPGEVSTANNTRHIFIDVIDARQKVLIAAAVSHPDVAIFKQAIASNEHYEVNVVVGEDLNNLNPADYGLIILYQLPSTYNVAIPFLNGVKASTASLWFVLGAQSNLAAFNQMQTALTYVGNNNSLQQSYSDINPKFTAFDIDAQSAKIIEGFDPLLAPLGSISVNTNATIALTQRVGKIKTQYPQLIFTTDKGKKMEYLIGEGLWRWKLSEAKNNIEGTAVGNLISKSVQYLSLKDDKRKFKVYSTKSSFDEDEPILLNAALYNDSYKPVNSPDVGIQIKNSQGKSYNFLFTRTDAAYQLDAGTLPAGNYSYTATTKLGDKPYTAKGIFFINNVVAEYQQTTANHQLLASMAAQTNGKMYHPVQLLNIYKDILNNDQIKTLSYEDRKYEELINYKWLFALTLVLLSVEWFFRKRTGEV
ncbi:MAG: hypothetical protein V4687_18990 [Bacteroidota bacterium]